MDGIKGGVGGELEVVRGSRSSFSFCISFSMRILVEHSMDRRCDLVYRHVLLFFNKNSMRWHVFIWNSIASTIYLYSFEIAL